MTEIDKALESLQQHDACDDCGKRTDGLMTCTYAHDGSTTKLCPDCIKDSGFCLRCGNYCAGMSSFDFSPLPGYCSDCRDELNDDDDDEWADDLYDPQDDWPSESIWGDDPDQEAEDDNPNDSNNL